MKGELNQRFWIMLLYTTLKAEADPTQAELQTNCIAAYKQNPTCLYHIY